MNRKSLLCAILLILILGLPAVADNYLVRLSAGTSVNALTSTYGAVGVTVTAALSGSGGGLYIVNIPPSSIQPYIVQSLQMSGMVQTLEPDRPVGLPVRLASSPNSHPSIPTLINDRTYQGYYGSQVWTAFLNQPAATLIRVSDAHKIASGAGVVADIDTGVDPYHPALAGALTIGYDFIQNVSGGYESNLNQDTTPILDQDTTPILDNDTTIVLNQDTTPILDQDTTPIIDGRLPPAYGHGTMVAGMIHLVAPTTKIMPLRAFDANGSSSISQIVTAIYWAIDHGATVINMSFSSMTNSPELAKAINYAINNNVVCVTSVGNDGQNVMVYPAAYDSVIGVASTTNLDTRSVFTNYGSDVNIAAPGEAVIVPYPHNHYAMAWGTSFSSPQVAGAVALLRHVYPGLSVYATTTSLSQAVPLTGSLGAGRLELVKALKSLAGSIPGAVR